MSTRCMVWEIRAHSLHSFHCIFGKILSMINLKGGRNFNWNGNLHLWPFFPLQFEDRLSKHGAFYLIYFLEVGIWFHDHSVHVIISSLYVLNCFSESGRSLNVELLKTTFNDCAYWIIRWKR